MKTIALLATAALIAGCADIYNSGYTPSPAPSDQQVRALLNDLGGKDLPAPQFIIQKRFQFAEEHGAGNTCVYRARTITCADDYNVSGGGEAIIAHELNHYVAAVSGHPVDECRAYSVQAEIADRHGWWRRWHKAQYQMASAGCAEPVGGWNVGYIPPAPPSSMPGGEMYTHIPGVYQP